MRELIKIMVVLTLFFLSTFVLLQLSGLLTLDEVRNILTATQQSAPLYLAILVVVLLYADLIIAVPTMTVAMLAGHFLGWPLGASVTLMGLFLAGLSGYFLSRHFGTTLLQRIYRNGDKLNEIQQAFNRSGPWVLISCRALPILPEVSCCMAGATRMEFIKFLPLFTLGTVPYALIVTYAGSVSSLERPQPAIITAITISLLLWGSWYLIVRRKPESPSL